MGKLSHTGLQCWRRKISVMPLSWKSLKFYSISLQVAIFILWLFFSMGKSTLIAVIRWPTLIKTSCVSLPQQRWIWYLNWFKLPTWFNHIRSSFWIGTMFQINYWIGCIKLMVQFGRQKDHFVKSVQGWTNIHNQLDFLNQSEALNWNKSTLWACQQNFIKIGFAKLIIQRLGSN